MTRERVDTNRSRPAFTLIELLVVVAIIALLISILLPSLARARELSKRAVCAANLKGMGTGFYTYANENSDVWPMADGGAGVSPTLGSSSIKYASPMMGAFRKVESNVASTQLSNSRNLWTLVRMQISTQKSFTCPSGDESPNDDDSPQLFWDFGKKGETGTDGAVPANNTGTSPSSTFAYNTLSYGYQVPWGTIGRPSSDVDMRMPLGADKGRWSAALEAAKPLPNPSVPNVSYSSSPDAWKPWNSPNHGGLDQGEGQNVLFADAHVDWAPKPTVGVGNDNIYTRWNDNKGGGLDTGSVVSTAGNEAPFGATDALIYP